MNIILKAAQFAKQAHGDQKRKHTGEPYIVHPMRVAGMMALHPITVDEGYAPLAMLTGEQMVAVAWLHDVLEDTTVTPAELEQAFGSPIVTGVVHLTGTPPTPGMNREQRKRHDFAKLAASAREIRIIKLLDRHDNLRDLVELLAADAGKAVDLGRDWLRKYAEETRWLVDAIGDADRGIADKLVWMAKFITTGA